MAFGGAYQVDDNYNGTSFQAGEWKARIENVQSKISQSGNEMAVIELQIKDQGKLRYYLVDDKSSDEAYQRTNKNLTRFFDCFHIQRGNFNLQSWIGKVGMIRIDKGAPNGEGKAYFEVKALIVHADKSQQHAPQQGASAYQGRTNTAPRNATQTAPNFTPPTQQNQYDDLDNVPF